MPINEWTQWLWPHAANHLWQATLVVAGAALLAWCLRNGSARVRFVVWQIALLKFALPTALFAYAWQVTAPPPTVVHTPSTAVRLIVNATHPAASSASFATAQLIEAPPAPSHNELGCLTLLLWVSVSVWLLMRWTWRYAQLRRALRKEAVTTVGRECEALRQLHAPHAVQLVITQHLRAVGVVGVWRPTIILPATLAAELNDEELAAVLRHELLHIARRDNLLGTFQLLLCSLFWFHPLVWLVHRRLLVERETICDEQVLRSGTVAPTYAGALWKVARFELGWAAAGVAYAGKHALSERIKRMLNPETMNRKKRGWSVAAVSLMALTVIGGSVWLARTQAQPSAPMTLQRLPGVFKDNDNRSAREALDQSRVVPLSFINVEGAPVVITAASMQAIAYEAEVVPPTPSTRGLRRIILTLENRTDRPVVGFAYEELFPDQDYGAVFEMSNQRGTKIEPHGVITFGKNNALHGSCEYLPADLRQIKLRLAGVKFQDEPHWGSFQAYATGKPIRRGVEVYAHGQPPVVSAETRRIVQESVTGQFSESDSGLTALTDVAARPVILSSDRPPYLDEAVAARISGVVVLSAILQADGTVRGLRVINGLSHGLTEQAVEVARRLKFTPATKDGTAVSVRMQLEYRFGG